ncbi:MAG: hypothetical protein FWH27_00215 [Planctomycetaceae bacterium]|nr:hypothetical protein [Planctomycetaceae bacterium]
MRNYRLPVHPLAADGQPYPRGVGRQGDTRTTSILPYPQLRTQGGGHFVFMAIRLAVARLLKRFPVSGTRGKTDSPGYGFVV